MWIFLGEQDLSRLAQLAQDRSARHSYHSGNTYQRSYFPEAWHAVYFGLIGEHCFAKLVRSIDPSSDVVLDDSFMEYGDTYDVLMNGVAIDVKLSLSSRWMVSCHTLANNTAQHFIFGMINGDNPSLWRGALFKGSLCRSVVTSLPVIERALRTKSHSVTLDDLKRHENYSALPWREKPTRSIYHKADPTGHI